MTISGETATWHFILPRQMKRHVANSSRNHQNNDSLDLIQSNRFSSRSSLAWSPQSEGRTGAVCPSITFRQT